MQTINIDIQRFSFELVNLSTMWEKSKKDEHQRRDNKKKKIKMTRGRKKLTHTHTITYIDDDSSAQTIKSWIINQNPQQYQLHKNQCLAAHEHHTNINAKKSVTNIDFLTNERNMILNALRRATIYLFKPFRMHWRTTEEYSILLLLPNGNGRIIQIESIMDSKWNKKVAHLIKEKKVVRTKKSY